MSVSALREITIGVEDLHARMRQFTDECGLSVLREGSVAPTTAARFLDAKFSTRAAILGRPDLPDSPRLRLVEISGGPPARTKGVRAPGPLGIGFSTRDIGAVHSRMEKSGLRFLSAPVALTAAAPVEAEPSPPAVIETYGQAEDGDFIVLSQGRDAEPAADSNGPDCGEPFQVTFTVTNLSVCEHFMRDVLEHEISAAEVFSGPPYDTLFGETGEVSFRRIVAHRLGFPSGQMVFLEFQGRPEPMAQTPGLSRGICRLRYDTTDLHASLSRVPGGGGSFVRGPEGVDDSLLGRGLVAMVRSPFGVLMEFWQKG